MRQPRIVRDVRRLTRPRRNRTNARHDGHRHLIKGIALVLLTIGQQAIQNS